MVPRKKRVFLSFDLATDAKLLSFASEQSKKPDSPYSIIDYSKKWTPPEKEWIEKLKKTISMIDYLMVMIGPKTCRSQNVLEEVDIAYNAGKPVIQLCVAKFGEGKPVPQAGKIYPWDWDALKRLLK